MNKKHPYKQKGPFHAIMPGSSRRASSYQDENKVVGYIPVHWPVLMTEAETDSTSLRKSDDDEGKLRIWYPIRERLIFEIDGKSKAQTLTYRHTDPPSPNAPLQDGDVDLIADMRRIWPKKSKIGSQCSASRKPTSVPPQVAAQVFIPGGEISSSTGGKHRVQVVFKPSQVKTPLKCEIVSDAVITFEAKKKVVIQSYSLDSGKPLDTLVFPVTGDLSFHIANADPKDIRYMIEKGAYSLPKRIDKSDADFELFYSILAPNETRNLPVPVETSGLFGLLRDCYVAMTER